MYISKIFEKLRHFYFNYDENDLPSTITSSAVIRRVQFALRMTISFLVGGFLAYGAALNNSSGLQYLIPVMCILSIQETFGMTLISAYSMITAIVPLTIFLFIIQKIGLGYHDYLAAELLLLISSLFVSYKCSQVQVRKIALIVNAVFFASIVNQKNLPSTFVFVLLELFIIGMVIALLVSLIIFPLFATIDFENRVNYCLENLQKMQTIVIQGFICQDEMGAQISTTRSSTIEQMVRTTMNLLCTRLVEAGMEPSRLLQRIFNRKRKHLFNLTIQEQEDFISSLMFHVSSLQLMVKQCQFNEYHTHLARELQTSLLHLDSCQSKVVSSLLSSSIIDRNEFDRYLLELEEAYKSLRDAYIEVRLQTVEHVLESAATIRSEDHLSHAFFLFQFAAIVRLLKQATKIPENKTIFEEFKDALKRKQKKKRRTLKEWLKPQWPRFVSAFKSMIIIGVGSIFVMVPRLASAFENGQWILIALVVTQGDTVGGALTTMKMRLVGTLFGSMWAYITYLSVNDNVYSIFGMLVPWILIFGYLKSSPNWGYAAAVAAFTPAVINLGRLPYGDTVPAGNFALLRIEENLVGIAVAIVLTIVIFPVFAIDCLKNNIQTTLQACRQSVDSMHSIYDQLFHYEHLNTNIVDVELKNTREIRSFVDAQRSRFHQLISGQRALVGHAALEPTMWWFRNNFPSIRYESLAVQQTDMFRMLHNVDAILMRVNEITNDDENQIKNLQIHAAGGHFLPDLHTELANLSRQLSDCLSLWVSYFTLTQTRFYRLFRDCTYNRTELNENDLLKHERCLIELHQIIHHLQNQHQIYINRLLDHYLDRLTEGDSPSNFIPYITNEKADIVFIGVSAMYYSTTQLARNALALGTNIHTIFELETTNLYRSF